MTTTKSVAEELVEHGLQPLAKLECGLLTSLHWHPERRIEIAVSEVSGALLVKGMKKYVVLNQAADGRETYERDLPGLMRYMEDHFPEAHLYLGFFRDIPVRLTPGFEMAESLEQRFARGRERFASLRGTKEKKQRLVSLFKEVKEFDEARSVLSDQTKAIEGEEAKLKAELQRLQGQLASHHEVLRSYQELGRATLLAFGYSSPLYMTSPEELGSTVDAVLADVMNTHHTSVRQKLEGGQLRLFIDELRFPSLLYAAESVGLFAPGQIDQLAEGRETSGLRSLRDSAFSMLQVLPAKDIEVAGHRVPAKQFGAKALWEFVKRVDAVEAVGSRAQLPSRGIFIGRLMEGDRVTSTPVFLPIDKLTHAYCSGISGCGKSFLGRVLVEGVLAEKRNVVVLDPGNQWVGLKLPEDRKEILAHYRRFDLDRSLARGFPTTFSQPREMNVEVYSILDGLERNAAVFSFKGLPKKAYCNLAAEILNCLFRTHSHAETEKLRTLVVIEEAHRFAKRKSDNDEEKKAVSRVEDAIDLIAREGRKYGLNVLIVSQTIRDFTHSAATIRSNVNTKIFMRNSDRELEYAGDYVADPRQLPTLKTGQALIYNPQFGTIKVAVRPPFSKVIELSSAQLRELVSPTSDSPPGGSDEEERLLEVIRKHFEEAGEPINVTQAMKAIGIDSGRKKQQLVDGLEQRGLIRSEKLKQRGGPRVLFPISDGS